MLCAAVMKKYGGFIPGIRPGQRTSDYIYKVLTRITLVGAVYLAIVCVIPEILIYRLNVPFYFGGTSLLIVIGVGLDTAQQIESHMGLGANCTRNRKCLTMVSQDKALACRRGWYWP